jgi:fructose-1-phosphate kinase PfkB-like protein
LVSVRVLVRRDGLVAHRDEAVTQIKWQTPSMSDARIAEMAEVLERLAGNVSCYAGGGSFAHHLREIAAEIKDNRIAPLP